MVKKYRNSVDRISHQIDIKRKKEAERHNKRIAEIEKEFWRKIRGK